MNIKDWTAEDVIKEVNRNHFLDWVKVAPTSELKRVTTLGAIKPTGDWWRSIELELNSRRHEENTTKSEIHHREVMRHQWTSVPSFWISLLTLIISGLALMITVFLNWSDIAELFQK